jgi:hypothetical protein
MPFDKQALGLAKEALFQGTANDVVSTYSNLGSNNPNKGPNARTLFYDAGMRTPGKYGQFLFYSLGSGENDFLDTYYRSESSDYNTRVSSIDSKNPSAGFLVRQTQALQMSSEANLGILSGLLSGFEGAIVGGLSAPYNWKDFLYCKHYGTIPNNYMVTLRRFPAPILDNLSLPSHNDDPKSSEDFTAAGMGRPVAQAVTWFGGNTGNTLNTLLSFSAGIEWKSVSQSPEKVQEAFSKGFFQDKPIDFAGDNLKKLSQTSGDVFTTITSLASGAMIATDETEANTRGMKAKGLRDRAKLNGGILGEYIWTSVDVVKNGYVRDMGLTFSWEGISVVFEYELTSVGEVNSKAALLDILGNLLSIGTNYGTFLTPDIRYNGAFEAIGFPGGDAGLQAFYKDPLGWLETYGTEIANIIGGGKDGSSDANGSPETMVASGANANGVGTDDVNKVRNVLGGIGKSNGNVKDAISELKTTFGDDAARLLRYAVTPDFLEKYQSPISFLTGAPIGEWHLTIGNPCNPIAMIGNLLCDDVSIEFGETLGPDDFPTSIKATFALKHARDRERGEIESIFNRGDGRLYQSAQTTSADQQSYNAFADSAGNILSEQVVQQSLQNGDWPSQIDIPDQLGPR